MEFTQEQFKTAFATWLAGAQDIINRYMASQFPTLGVPQLSARHGKRYIAIVRIDGLNSSCVDAFIDTTTGDVLKAASYRAPAKHARGNIFDEKHGLGMMGPHGPASLK
jgi:hypothetical protein